MILIKKYNYDVLLAKNINDTISIRVVLYVSEFEVDITQKYTSKRYKKNINTNPKIINKLKEFLYQYSKV